MRARPTCNVAHRCALKVSNGSTHVTAHFESLSRAPVSYFRAYARISYFRTYANMSDQIPAHEQDERDFKNHKGEFDRICEQYKLRSEEKAGDIADFLTGAEDGVSAEDFAKKFDMEAADAIIFLSWINVGIRYAPIPHLLIHLAHNGGGS